MIYEAFPKLIELGEFSKEGEPTIQIVRPGEYNRLGHVKTANEALDYIKHVKPIPGKTVILVLAMTAGEFYGPNRNGDGWPERPVIAGPTKIGPDAVLPKHYKTFETNANIFKHHINKNPDKRIGDVLRAFYNWAMHRVELLLALNNDRAEDIVERIEKEEFPAVSMGCFQAGTWITMGDGTRKPIEKITVGDTVLTHKGRARKVTSVHKRPYKGILHTIKPAVYPATCCTDEHPFLASPREQLRKKNSKATFRWDADAIPEPDWVHAKCLEEQHLLFEPVITETLTPDFVTRPFARLFGYYLAEGMVLRNAKQEIVAIQLHVNREDPVLDEIEKLCADYGTRNPPNIYPRPQSEKALAIDIWDKELAQWCYEHGGSYGRHKTISYSAMRWDSEMQKEILGAYANGDGHGTKAGALLLSTASPNLAWQWVALLHRLGITPSIQNIEHKAGSGFSNKNTFEWVIHIGKQWAQDLQTVCAKIEPHEIKARRNDRYFYNGQIATPIRSLVSEQAEIDVYNFEVEDDESYVAGGVSVHNCKVKFDVCSICGNKAPSRKQYCDHAKYDLGGYTKSGKRKFVWNPSPKFFDISMVRRPADKLGFMMKKVAEAVPEIRSSAIMGEYIEDMSRKVANLRKMSIISKVLNGEAIAVKEDDGNTHTLREFGNRIAKPVANSMQPLADTTIRELLKYQPAEVLSTLSSMGILLTTPEFIKYFVWKIAPDAQIPPKMLDRAVACQQTVFEMLANNPHLLDDIEDTGFVDVAEKHINPDLAEKAAALLEKRSQAKEYLYRHLVPDIFKEDTRHLGNWDVINARDPRTGKTYRTTRLAARQAADVAGERQLSNLVGGGAMLAGAAGLSMLPVARLAWPLAGALGYGGAKKFMKGYGGYPSSRAETGETIYHRAPRKPALGFGQWRDRAYPGTELIEKRSAHSNADDAHALIRAAMDIAHCPDARQEQINTDWLKTAEGLSFENAATKLGEVICL